MPETNKPETKKPEEAPKAREPRSAAQVWVEECLIVEDDTPSESV